MVGSKVVQPRFLRAKSRLLMAGTFTHRTNNVIFILACRLPFSQTLLRLHLQQRLCRSHLDFLSAGCAQVICPAWERKVPSVIAGSLPLSLLAVVVDRVPIQEVVFVAELVPGLQMVDYESPELGNGP